MAKILNLGKCMGAVYGGDNPRLELRIPAEFLNILGRDNLLTLKKALDEMFEDGCGCIGSKFIEHIKEHLVVGQDVICKICGKTPIEISKEKNNAGNTKED